MSITSSNKQERHTEFTDLLARHAGLADWLAPVVSGGDEVRLEGLWLRFLAECADQGIARTAYPFNNEEQARRDFQAYLKDAQEEIRAFRLSSQDEAPVEQLDFPPPDVNYAPALTAGQGSDQAPVGDDTSSSVQQHILRVKNSEMEMNAEADQPAAAETPLISLPAHEAESDDVTELQTVHIPAVSLPEVEKTPATEEDGLRRVAGPGSADGEAGHKEHEQPEEDVTELETAHMPVVGKEERKEAEELADDDAGHSQAQDIAGQETAHTPAISSVRREEAEKPEKDIAGQATAHMPAGSASAPEKASESEKAVAADTSASAEDEKGGQAPQVVSQGPRATVAAPRRSRRPRRPRRQRTLRQKIVAWVMLVVVLAAVLIPGIFLVTLGINAYTTYRQLSDQAHSAVNHLMDIKTTFSAPSGDKSHLDGLLDTSRLERAQQDFIASGRDFQQLQARLQQSTALQTITTYLPQYRTTLTSAQAASQIGIDVAQIGQIATTHAHQLAPTFSGSILAASGQPLVTQNLLDTLGTTIDQVMPLLRDIQTQAQFVSLDSLPMSAEQKTQVGQLLQLLPQAISDLGIARSMVGKAGWVLGVNQPRTFLVQTMDRDELRGAGGFTGQYGELTINGGRVEPFKLKDISNIEYVSTSVTQGQLAPEQYRDWWPFANWGLRDSNVSADFPTTAQVAINLYKQETGNQVEGLISFTPVVIEHVLSVIGPIQVPGYDVTVTAQNLEEMLHFYQLDNRGILKQILKQPDDTETSQRKRFTSYLTTLVLDKVRAAPAQQLLGIAHQMLNDLKSRELQMYFADPTTENILVQYGYAGMMDRSTTHDGLYVVQQNLSASKASQYVQTIMHDTVTLDNQGGATHQLQIRLVYNQAGPVYGYDTYYDYLRVYVPPSSHLLSGDGFSSGTPLCGGAYGACPVDGPYPAGELVCPSGQYQPGAEPPTLSVPDGVTWQPLQTLGGPTSTTSDEAGRAMYGGWVIVPKNCTMTVTLSWYVPPASGHPYSLFVQRQAGVFPELDLSILPDAGNCTSLGTAGLHYDKILTQDMTFALPAYHASTQAKSCYPRSGV